MPERVYVSDADLQIASDLEIIRISRRIVADFDSSFPGRRKKMLSRIREHAHTSPISTIPLILRYTDHFDPKVREYARMLAEELTRSPAGELALIESIFSSHNTIGECAANILETRNMDGKRIRDLYVDTEKLFASCRAINVYTEDVKELLLEAVRLYKNKLVEQAYENMILSNDLLRDRLEWNQNTRKYIQDVLKLTPQLSRSGVSIDNIHESLKILTDAVKKRDYHETRDLVESKKIEASVGSQIGSVLSFICKRLNIEKLDMTSKVNAEDQWIFDSMKKLGGEVNIFTKKGKRIEALESIYTFVAHDFAGQYLEKAATRIESGDKRAAITTGQAVIGLLKILYVVLPNMASELFDTHLKTKVGTESIEDTPMPSPLKSIERRT